MPSNAPVSENALAQRAVFLSYAREDTAAAQRIADALRSQGVEVWFDQSELRGGDVWDQKIRRQIRECALFVPIISGRTQARGEGYFRLEWKLAVERTHLMAEGVPFLAPVVVDETPEGAAIVPAEFLRVQWIRLPGALPTPEFVSQVRRMLESPGKAAVFTPRTSTGAVPRQQSNRMLVVGGLIALVVAVAATVAIMRRQPAPAVAPAPAPAAAQAPAPAEAVDPKSLAVIPFENMSEDKENAFFADGVHEDVLTNLSFIKDLHVVSRTSVMQYRGTTKSIKQIGRELGVAYVLEGSVRREGNKVRVTGQLIDARTDEHVWAKAYDRDLNDIFAIQGELAQAIADALQSVLSPETKVLLARRPTENTEAYDDYLKARQMRSGSMIGARPSIALLEDAVRLDPNFAQAWAELASRRAYVLFGDTQTVEQRRLAKEAMDNAVRLAPDDPAVIEGLGDYFYYGFRDYARATEQYMRLEQLRPNDAVVFSSLGLIQRREGRMSDALPNLRRALQLDPTNHQYVASLAQTLVAVRQYDEALEVGRKFSAAHPDDLEAAFGSAFVPFFANGSTAETKAFAQRPVGDSEHSIFLYYQKDLADIECDWAGYIRLDDVQRYYGGSVQDPPWNQDIFGAEAFAESGDMPAARTRAAESLAAMKQVLVNQPNNAELWAAMSLAHALLGEKQEALDAARKSAELLPESKDGVTGPSNSITCAIAMAWAGEKDRAFAELGRLFHVPFGANVYATRYGFLPLRDDPRFKAMMEDPANNAPMF
jgi:TolB-like protein/cytochrome c-type biogenesis protein CcmH/NrfG